MNRLFFWALCFGLLGRWPAGAIVGGVPDLTPAQKAIHDAASVRGPGQREEAVRQAIREGLSAEDKEVRNQVFSYLSQNTRWLDLRPFEKILLEFSRIDDTHRGQWLLDDAELTHASRAVRLDLFQRAIVSGEITLPHGRALPRDLAMSFAALQGLGELEPLVEQFANHIEERWKESFQFETFPALFRLGSGARDREDALRLSSLRLASMADKDVKAKMDSDAGFRGAVLQVARDVCVADPFSGRLNSGCADMKSVVGRQTALDRGTRKSEAESSVSGSGTPVNEQSETWLARLRRHMPDA